MYTPPAFAIDSPAEILAVLRGISFGHLVTAGADGSSGSGMQATALPFVIDDTLTTVRAHVARANRHWRAIDGTAGLLIVPGVDAYVSPRWYPSKKHDGKVVPTWNYEVVHLHGTIGIHDDVEWKRQIVTDLTSHHEAELSARDHARPWDVTDAPAAFIDAQLGGIVGVHLTVTAVEASRKLSQNRSEGDRAGAAAGLASSDRPGDLATARRME